MAEVRDIPNVGSIWPSPPAKRSGPRRKPPEKRERERERDPVSADADGAPAAESGDRHFDGYA